VCLWFQKINQLERKYLISIILIPRFLHHTTPRYTTLHHTIPSSKPTFNDAIAHFNIGNLATIKIFMKLDMKPGAYRQVGLSLENVNRVKNSLKQDADNDHRRVLFVFSVFLLFYL